MMRTPWQLFEFLHVLLTRAKCKITGAIGNAILDSTLSLTSEASAVRCSAQFGIQVCCREIKIEHKDPFSKDTGLRRMNSASHFGDTPAGQDLKNKK